MFDCEQLCVNTHSHRVFFVRRFFCSRLIHRRWRNRMDFWRMVPYIRLHYAGSHAEWYPLMRRPLKQHDRLHWMWLHLLFGLLRPRWHLLKYVIVDPLIFYRHVDYLWSTEWQWQWEQWQKLKMIEIYQWPPNARWPFAFRFTTSFAHCYSVSFNTYQLLQFFKFFWIRSSRHKL